MTLTPDSVATIAALVRDEPMPFVLEALADALKAEAWRTHACYQLGNSSQVAARNDCEAKWAKVQALVADRTGKDACPGVPRGR